MKDCVTHKERQPMITIGEIIEILDSCISATYNHMDGITYYYGEEKAAKAILDKIKKEEHDRMFISKEEIEVQNIIEKSYED